MGCGQSKPAVKQDSQPANSPTSQTPKPQPALPSQQLTPNTVQQSPPPDNSASALAAKTHKANGFSVEVGAKQGSEPVAPDLQADASESRKEGIHKSTSSGSSSTRRSLRQRTPSSSTMETSNLVDAGPARDYGGLQLVFVDNERLTHIVTLASSILKVPLSFVVLCQKDKMVLANGVGLEDADKQWLPDACAWSLAQGAGLTVIENMEEDDRTNSLKWVSEDPQVCFFAATPICTTSGERLGSLCLMDFEPRKGISVMCQSLTNLAEMVAREVQAEEQMNSGEALLERAIDTYWDACVYCDTRQGPKWTINFVNDAFVALTGLEKKEVIGGNLWDILELAGSYVPEDAFGKISEVTKRLQTHDIMPVTFIKGKQATVHSLASRKPTYKINMRPMRQMHINNYSLALTEAEIRGLYFAVIQAFQNNINSRGQFAIVDMDASLIPFEGVEMGPIIGKGSFGSVFKATWSGRVVAIKIIPFSDIAKVDATGNPLEASLMLDMKHPNIVETYEHALQSSNPGEEESGQSAKHTSAGSQASASSNLQFWLMLEFCDVGTLSDGLEMGLLHETLNDGDSQLVVPKVTFILETLRDIAKGMEFVHSFNILHSDLTAGNVLLDSTEAGVQGTRGFVAKIADFGLSRQALTTRVETNTYGTVTHMPPELLNEGIISKAADVYAFGVLVYEVYSKKPVWEGLRHPQIIHAIAVQKKHPLLPESAPQAVKELANSCMAADPQTRPNFTQIIASIDAML